MLRGQLLEVWCVKAAACWGLDGFRLFVGFLLLVEAVWGGRRQREPSAEYF